MWLVEWQLPDGVTFKSRYCTALAHCKHTYTAYCRVHETTTIADALRAVLSRVEEPCGAAALQSLEQGLLHVLMRKHGTPVRLTALL